ncbi:MAG: 4Fe-4S dicluster domain-containing protein [Proteobacteria bacterium]|nr:4Fe-4S dicluster domain-containing protein [Pseudomonadota bacterium]
MIERKPNKTSFAKRRMKNAVKFINQISLLALGLYDTENSRIGKLAGRLPRKRKPGEGRTDLKRSKGLKSKFIDLNKFDLEPFMENKMVTRSFQVFGRIVSGVLKSRKDYRKELTSPSRPPKPAPPEFWKEIYTRAESLGIGLIGFAPVDENLIFTSDFVGKMDRLYAHGIVLGMEMDFTAIDSAPGPEAGLEAMRIYAELGVATNRLADFIRSRGYRAIACHPLGGPILYPAMAVRAGLGEMGRSGLLITKKYGPRQRLSMVATDASPLPETAAPKFGIAEFCDKCRKCFSACPAGAVLKEPVGKGNGIISRIDQDKCIRYFYEAMGCSICLKVCPFHQKGYEQVIKTLKN